MPLNIRPRWVSAAFSSLLRVVALAGALLCGNPADSAPHFVDLRQIEPIHGDAASGSQKATVCYACHGANGAPTAPLFPRLSGQRPQYLYHRLVSFHLADPKDTYYAASPMTPLAAHLTDQDMRDLAIYFATQPPQAMAATAAETAPDRGQQIFRTGDPPRGVPPCQGCHGTDANGSSVRSGRYAAYPSLRGQSAPYLIARLKSYRDGLPHDTSNALIMGGVARNLDDESIEALAAWLSSLSPARSR